MSDKIASLLANSACVINSHNIPCGEGLGFLLGLGAFVLLILLVVVVLLVVSMWKVFEKAGQKGWKSIIPVYNYIVMLRLIKKPEWLVLFLFVPVANVIVAVIIIYHLVKAFGKGIGFTVGMFLLPFIFYPILAFGKAKYTEPVESHNTIL